ncbi:hypothetical protein VTP01DRAFT_9951 [Rhizomucor pusillus]|uniref:uncharacterized protein n=1 Tax=Rhizomucor pusillus TaxID=4840 RepID=UPI003743C531
MPAKRRNPSKARSSTSAHRKSSIDESQGSSDALTQQPQQSEEERSSNNAAVTLLAAEKSGKKWRNMAIRTFTTLLMIGAFLFVLACGYIWSIVAVMAITIAVYREVIQIAQVPAKEKSVRWFKTMSWYFLITTEYFLYGESIIYYFTEIVMVDRFLLPFATHHRFISFMLYVLGFVFFVANLKKGQYAFQMAQFCYTHMALLLIVVQSHFIVDNILEGLIWFVMPAALVVCNDTFAYICGFFFGKTPLIQLSPKKTVEGFVGGFVWTLLLGFALTTVLMRFDYIVCPVQDLGASAWSGVSCDPKNPVFTPVPWQLPSQVVFWLKYLFRREITEVYIAPVQLHTIVMACFASLIAPFGGFFASAVKRAFKIKDFGQSIPGHGGLTDRMDCQFLMGLFAHMYYQSFIKTYNVSVGSILALVINNLTAREQVELLERLQTYLTNQEILDGQMVTASNFGRIIEKAQQSLLNRP